ncbi:TMV resistance protein N-like [Vigna unguiculata]|uniref:TMV resistance protein N-like n=1 Tax=Vigna unguiculata TaxID=3917 RepID=UPI00101662CD|nr:TMV resistance protein N-like [Vigna unguiculata]
MAPELPDLTPDTPSPTFKRGSKGLVSKVLTRFQYSKIINIKDLATSNAFVSDTDHLFRLLTSLEFASSTSKLPDMYDVLIHFTGEDIRRKFVSHLESALSAVGFTTFLLHQNAVNPMHIEEHNLNLCRVAIVVFTKTYSQSAWCLHQLQQIIQWHQTYCRHVLPVYYEIQPSDVRLQNGDFGKAFEATAHQTFSEQQLEHGMSRWSHALTKAAHFYGWDESNYRSDAELVDTIVKGVLNLPLLSATEFPVGLQSYVERVIRTIENESTGVCMIGISGMEGSGKTTVAKAVYNQIHDRFIEKSFIEDNPEVSRTRGHLHLLKKLLLDILKIKVEIQNVEMGRIMIRERLYGKRMLIVLDDLNQYKYHELSDLWECRAWSGRGSVIIITSTYENLLRTSQVDAVFRINPMNPNESLELLSWHAFKEAKPKEEYHDLAKTIVTHCGGLPLALEVLGSYLYERTKKEWHTVLSKLVRIPQLEVLPILKISFNGLRNQMEKDLFLDICCFFVGKSRAYVTKILNGCGIDADSGIRVLIERSLIKVKKNNKFGMHSVLRDMGQQIVREISGKEPENCRRWYDERMKHALSKNNHTKVMQTLRDFFKPYPLEVRDTSRMLKLAGHSEYLSKKLGCISLQGFSSDYLPNDLHLHDAIVIDIKHSLLRLVCKKPQVLASLKVLNLSHSKYLTKVLDFSRLPSLEQLILKDCPRLREVHKSIGCLCNLTLLNLKDCTSLRNLPGEIYMLKSLKTLILSGCPKIDLLETDIVQMKSLVILITENTASKQVPFSIVTSKSIGYISLCGLEGLSHNLFPSIIRFWMSPTMNTLSYKHSFCMDMENNSWDDFAPMLSSLANLRSVLVQCDTEFQLSKQLETIMIEYGANSTKPGTSKQHFKSSLIGVGRCKYFFNAVSNSISQVFASIESCDASLPGDNDPYWLAHTGEGHSVSFIVPQNRVLNGLTLCVVYLSIPEIVASECLRSVLIVNYTKCTLHLHNHGTAIFFNDIDWRGIISNLGSGDKVEIFLIFCHGLVVTRTIVYLIFAESNDLEMEPVPTKNSHVRFIKKV